jgi:hypothetical protein
VLFYLDLECLLETGETATKNTYVALEHGPVIAQYQKRLIGALEAEGLARQEQGEFDTMPVRLLDDRRMPPRSYAAIAKRLAETIGAMTATEASELSHDNPGWKLAWEGRGPNDQPKPINMLIAMQELAEGDDPWLTKPLTSGERAAVEKADQGKTEPW